LTYGVGGVFDSALAKICKSSVGLRAARRGYAAMRMRRPVFFWSSDLGDWHQVHFAGGLADSALQTPFDGVVLTI